MDTRELAGRSFACLEGCGFCCTFQPEVSTRELALLRRRFAPKPVAIAAGGERTYLALHNKCGACTLLERRACTAYDLRPAHCRYFPFHVHFGRAPEVAVNYACRGVVHAPGGDLSAAFQAQVLDVAPKEEWRALEDAARAAYGEFERRARRAGKWGSVAAVVERAVSPRLLTADGLADATARAGEPLSARELTEEALEPFAEEDVAKRPFHLTADLRWLTFEARPGALRVLEMDEKGALREAGEVRGLSAWEDPAPPLAAALAAHLATLARRASFEGSVFALVDDSEYSTSVEEAAWWRLAQVAADLVVRARIVRALGATDAQVADETARFYDGAFLDEPTIGGWL